MQLLCFPSYFHIMVQLTFCSIICTFKASVAFEGVQSNQAMYEGLGTSVGGIFHPCQAPSPVQHTALLMYSHLSTLSMSEGEQPFHLGFSRPAYSGSSTRVLPFIQSVSVGRKPFEVIY